MPTLVVCRLALAGLLCQAPSPVAALGKTLPPVESVIMDTDHTSGCGACARAGKTG
jgi:hypothetical protein